MAHESWEQVPPEGLASRLRAPLFVVLAFSALLASRLFWLLSRYAVNIFFSDQWDFNNSTLFEQHTFWQIFRWQHGPHRQGLGGVISKLLEPLFHWNSRSEAFLVGAIIAVAV